MDIREVKRSRRDAVKARRRGLSPEEKNRLDAEIRRRFLRLNGYRRARVLIAYWSTAIEVDTIGIIRHALAHHKKVALPRCIEGTRQMRFYYIRSEADLVKGSYGLMEPSPDCEPMHGCAGSICIVPGLCYDRLGYRLGYGGGYYDRFLGGYRGRTVGLIYSQDLCRRLPHGRYDRPVDLIVSERGICPAAKERGASDGKAAASSLKSSPAPGNENRHEDSQHNNA